MKRVLSILAVIILLSAVSGTSAQASLGQPDFPYCADLSGAVRPGGLAGVTLAGDVLEQCTPVFDDLRLFDSHSREIPFVVLENSRPAEPQEEYALEMTDYHETAGKAVIIAQLPETHRSVSVIEINTPDRDFKKGILLESGRDGRTWRVVSRDVLYDFSSRVNLRKTRIEFPKTADRYFRLTVSDDGGKAQPDRNMRLSYQGLDFSVEGMTEKKLSIKGVHGLTAPQRERIPVYDSRTFRDLKTETDKDGNTVIVLDASLPVERIAFDIADAYYSRSVTISTSDTGKNERVLFRGAIHKFVLDGQKEEQTALDVRSRKSRTYRIVIENRKNPPLAIRGITLSWVEQNLYFITEQPGEVYTICFGNESLSRPEYDIARFISNRTLTDHQLLQLRRGDIRVNSAYVPVTPKAARDRIEKTVLIVVVLLVVALLAIWIFRLMKKLDHEKGP